MVVIEWHYVYKLLSGSGLTIEEREEIEDRLRFIEGREGFYEKEFDIIIEKLKLNQIDRVTHGSRYSITDIKNHLKKLR